MTPTQQHKVWMGYFNVFTKCSFTQEIDLVVALKRVMNGKAEGLLQHHLSSTLNTVSFYLLWFLQGQAWSVTVDQVSPIACDIFSQNNPILFDVLIILSE